MEEPAGFAMGPVPDWEPAAEEHEPPEQPLPHPAIALEPRVRKIRDHASSMAVGMMGQIAPCRILGRLGIEWHGKGSLFFFA